MKKVFSENEVSFPDIPNLEFSRDELLRMSKDELQEVIPQKIVMSGNSIWDIWEDISRTTARLGNLEITWIKTESLDKKTQSLLIAKNLRLALIKQPIIISGPPQSVFDELYCEIKIFSVTSKRKKLPDAPTIKELIPGNKWHDVLKWGSRLALTINNQSQLTLDQSLSSLGLLDEREVSEQDDSGIMDLLPKIELHEKNTLNEDSSMFFVVNPFEYVIRRPLIKSDGIGSNQARWFFGRGPSTEETSGLLEDNVITVGIVALVPEKTCLEVHCRMAARHHMDAKIPNFISLVDTLQLVSTAVKNFIVGGAPLIDEKINGYPAEQKHSPIC